MFQKISLAFLIFIVPAFIFINPDVASAATYYVHSDHLGSTSVVTKDGEVVSREAHYPYGTTRFETGVKPTEKGFTGQISDETETDLMYYKARYYNPVTAKFTQSDNINDQLNRYAYVANNPVNLVDPTGNRILDDSGEVKPDETTPVVPVNNFSAVVNSSNPMLSSKFYTVQAVNGQCGPSSIAMVMSYYGNNNDTFSLMVQVNEDFIKSGFLNYETGDTDSTHHNVTEYLNSAGYKTESSSGYGNSNYVTNHFKSGGGPVIVNTDVGYKPVTGSNQAEHWVVLYGVLETEQGTYAIVGDPWRSYTPYGSQRTLSSGMTPYYNGTFLIPLDEFTAATNGLGISVSNGEEQDLYWSAKDRDTENAKREDLPGNGYSSGSTGTNGSGAGGCFTNDTKILMSDGTQKNISEIKVGDLVISYDPVNRKKITNMVVEILVHPDNTEGYLFINGKLKITPNHVVWVENRHRWLSVKEVGAGDVMINENGDNVEIQTIEKVEIVQTVYNLHLKDDPHNFVAEGLLVHNIKSNQ